MHRFLIIAALLAATPALAVTDVAALYRDGKYQDAIKAGTAANTPAALVYAGRARIQIAAYDTTSKATAQSLIKAATADFDAALAKAPGDADAQLQKAIALGYTAKLDRSPGGAKTMRNSLDAILARDPNNALAWAALGGWHGGSIATLGKFVASTVLGASTAEMDKAFAKAMALDPNDPAHPVFYALTLLDISTSNADRAKLLLTNAAKLPAEDEFGRDLKAAGARVLAQLNAGNAKAAQAQARQLMPFGTVA